MHDDCGREMNNGKRRKQQSYLQKQLRNESLPRFVYKLSRPQRRAKNDLDTATRCIAYRERRMLKELLNQEAFKHAGLEGEIVSLGNGSYYDPCCDGTHQIDEHDQEGSSPVLQQLSNGSTVQPLACNETPMDLQGIK